MHNIYRAERKLCSENYAAERRFLPLGSHQDTRVRKYVCNLAESAYTSKCGNDPCGLHNAPPAVTETRPYSRRTFIVK